MIGAGILYLIGWIYLKLRKSRRNGNGRCEADGDGGRISWPTLTMFVLCAASLLGGAYGILILVDVFRKRFARYRVHLPAQAASRAWQAAQVAMRGLEIPFGVFLCIVSLVGWFYGAQMMRAYMGLLRHFRLTEPELWFHRVPRLQLCESSGRSYNTCMQIEGTIARTGKRGGEFA